MQVCNFNSLIHYFFIFKPSIMQYLDFTLSAPLYDELSSPDESFLFLHLSSIMNGVRKFVSNLTKLFFLLQKAPAYHNLNCTHMALLKSTSCTFKQSGYDIKVTSLNQKVCNFCITCVSIILFPPGKSKLKIF